MSAAYTLQLKKRQLLLLKEYKELVSKALNNIDTPTGELIRSFREQERLCLQKMDHLNRVIKAFANKKKDPIDLEINDAYLEVRSKIDELIDNIKNKKQKLGLREKHYLLRSHRQNRLYREVKPAYIDIRT